MLNYSTFALTLTPQNIGKISISISDDITDANAGVAVAYKCIIALVIEEYDLVYDEVGSSYGEARKDFINAEKNTYIR